MRAPYSMRRPSAARSSLSKSTWSTGALARRAPAYSRSPASRTAFKIVGIPDEYTVTGSQADIFRHYGISMEGLAETMRSLLRS